MSNSIKDIEGWLTGTTNGAGLRPWCTCYFNGTREDSYDLQAQLNVKITGDQKLTPFPHWTLSTRTSGKRYAHLSEPVSDWFVGGLVAQSLEPWHPPGVQTSATLHQAIDFYYGMGFLINFYSHTLSTGLGDAGALVPDYVSYCSSTNAHPRMWAANSQLIYQWWLQRANAQISATFATNGLQSITTFSISGATDTNTSVEVLVPGATQACTIAVVTNGSLAGTNTYRISGQSIKLRVGASVTNARGQAVTVVGTILEQPPTQAIGGGINSTVTVTLASPLAVGQSVAVEWLLGVKQIGNFRFSVSIEAF